MKHRYTPALLGLALALMALVPADAAAQGARYPQDAVDAVTSHFRSQAPAYATPSADLAGLAPTDAYTDPYTGTSYVYLRQRVNGIEVYNGTAAAAVTRAGVVYGANAQFVTGLAQRANGATPAIGSADAIQMAARQLGIEELGLVVLVEEQVGVPGGAVYTIAGTDVRIPARLVYFATETGPVRLAWDVTIPHDVRSRASDDGALIPGETHVWNARVDAVTGSLLDYTDLVDHDAWPAPRELAERSFAPLAEAASGSMAMSGSYRVIPMPFESPNHGAFALVTNPHNPTASPQGWHNTGSTSYTITRGNNVHAYEDRANVCTSQSPASCVPGASPDGGAGLVFDFPFNPSATPQTSLNAAVTNLFYWNNIVHDVMYQYGFNEPAGNFQQTNFTSTGVGNDYVQAEAQDGSGTDNANFNTPADGGRPRMQMYEWTPAAHFEITAPPSIAGPYQVGQTVASAGPPPTPDWGASSYDLNAPLIPAYTSPGAVSLGCIGSTFSNQSEFAGKWVLVYRGTCPFSEKARTLQGAGASGVIIYNCDPEDCPTSANPGEAIVNMTMAATEPQDITIPVLFVPLSVGRSFVLNSPGVVAHGSESAFSRDSDLDAGIIAHEYGHGISNRLVGGPSNVSCLGNQEQMGEGWSDFFGMILTMRPGDTGAMPRGVGTYVNFEPTTGTGIRNRPYSTSFAVNDFTYQDVISFAGTTGQPRSLTVPHGTGFVWATMLWDMTWELIQTNGWNADIYNANGTAGNQIALRLVTEALKVTACNPGFVNGRDAILAADQAVFGGAYRNQIWIAFARRGLGQGASQGSSASVNDGVASFTLPPGVANEPGVGSGEAAVVTAPRPNPAAAAAELTVELVRPEAVRVELFDALGRQVALAHDGEMAAGVRTPIALETAGLAPGVYVWRVTGESFAESGRLTVVR